MSFRLGIDVGGTFTDFAVFNELTGELFPFKMASVPQQPSRAVLAGIQKLHQDGKIVPSEIQSFLHGTTLATNTLIERRGAKTGLLVTRGFRDVLLVGRLRLRNPFDFSATRPEPIVPRRLTREIKERMRADGEVIEAIDVDEVVREALWLRAEGVQAIAVAFVNSYRNELHEVAAANAIRDKLPGLYVCTSSELWPQIREYERTLVSAINGYIGSRISGYLSELREGVRAVGIPASILVTKSNGGVANATEAAARPVELLLSGPAAGVIGASHLGRLAGFPRIITVDIGGTSADLSVVDGQPLYSTEAEVGEFPVTIPAVDVTAIGAGGGSVAWLDSAGVLKVGPQSAGADPGPACYGLGNSEPTITDAYLTLGIVGEDRFLSGAMRLDRQLAVQAIRPIGEALKRTPEQAAEAILEVATSNMYRELMTVLARKGVDPSDFALFLFGGAGATHGFLLAEEVGFRKVVVPRFPGVLCALGALVADLKRDFIRTRHVALAPGALVRPAEILAREIDELEARGRDWAEANGVTVGRLEFEHSADMRYVGQSFEVQVSFRASECSPDGVAKILSRFHQRHAAAYGYSEQGAATEIINIRTTAVVSIDKPSLKRLNSTGNFRAASTRPIFFQGRWYQAAVYRREEQIAGAELVGPVIVEQYDTTTFLPPGWRIVVDEYGNLIGEKTK